MRDGEINGLFSIVVIFCYRNGAPRFNDFWCIDSENDLFLNALLLVHHILSIPDQL